MSVPEVSVDFKDFPLLAEGDTAMDVESLLDQLMHPGSGHPSAAGASGAKDSARGGVFGASEIFPAVLT